MYKETISFVDFASAQFLGRCIFLWKCYANFEKQILNFD